jgi:hypothetical protein
MSKNLPEKHDLYMNSLREYVREAKVKLKNMIPLYQFRVIKFVAGHPALIRLGGDYASFAIRQK